MTRIERLRAVMLLACLMPCLVQAYQINLGSLTCDQYEKSLMNPPAASTGAATPDAVDVIMWLFGFAVAKSGAHVMYGDALQQFGNGLDSECKIHPDNTLLDSVGAVKLAEINPMDLTTLACTAFAVRHADMAQSDPQSANTIMMWLYGFSVGKTGGHLLDSKELPTFSAAIAKRCTDHPDSSLFDVLTAVKVKAAQ
jgi:hypothetical protein